MIKLRSILIICLLYTGSISAFTFPWSSEAKELNKEKKQIKLLKKEKSKLIAWKVQHQKVKKYLSENKMNKIQDLFEGDEKDFKKAIRKNKISEATDLIKKMDYVYSKNNVFQDKVLYEKSQLQMLENVDVIPTLEQFLVDYPNSEYINKVIFDLQKTYLADDRDEDIIRVFQLQKGFPKPQQEYWVAQAEFNLNQYDAAARKFTALKTDERFSYKSNQMLVLITALNDDYKQALLDIDFLLSKDYKKEASFHVSFLIKARLLAVMNDQDQAIQNFLYYFEQENENNINSSPYYEIAELYYDQEKLTEAETYLNKSIEIADSREVYTDSKYMLGLIAQKKGNVSESEKLFDEAINQSDYFVSLLNQKYTLMKEMKSLLKSSPEKIVTDEERKTFQVQRIQKSEEINERIKVVNDNIESYKKILGDKEIAKLNDLESEYSRDLNEIDDYELKINQLLSTNNKEIPAVLDQFKLSLEDDIVFWYASKYLRNIDQRTNSDYVKAFLYAEEKYDYEKLLNICDDIDKVLVKKNKTNKRSKVAKIKELITQKLANVDVETKFEFGEINESNIQQQIINEELESITMLEQTIDTAKVAIEKNYHKKLARKEAKKKDKVQENAELLEQQYLALQQKLVDSLEGISKKYEADLLDVLFEETKALDAEYQEKYFEE